MADTLVELKNKKEERADQVRRYVDEYAALALEADRIKQRMDGPPQRGAGPAERTRQAVYATGNKWAIENFEATHG